LIALHGRGQGKPWKNCIDLRAAQTPFTPTTAIITLFSPGARPQSRNHGLTALVEKKKTQLESKGHKMVGGTLDGYLI